MKTNQTTNIICAVVLAGALLTVGFQAHTADFAITGTINNISGTNGLCPGGYIGYISYTKTVAQGWGWAPTNTVHTATDTNRADTKVEFSGKNGDSGCNQTKVTVPDPTASPKYRFNVYFTNNMPTNSYPLVLSGFSP